MNKSYLTGDIHFSFSFNLSYIDEMKDGIRKEYTSKWERNCIYSAIIKDVDGDIFIQLVGFNKEGNEDTISFMSRQWNDYIPYFEFGKYIEIHEAYMNESPVELNLSSTRLRGMALSHDCYCCFSIDNYQYSYTQKNEECTISYYLSKTSKNLAGEFWGACLLKGDVEPKKISLNQNFSCVINVNNDSEFLPIKIDFDSIFLSKNEVEKEFRLLCDIVSFYYAVPIECCMSVEYTKDLVKITREISHYNEYQKVNKNKNLCYLNYGISHHFIDFLTVISEHRNKLEDNLELLHTTMNDYVRSFGLNEESRFLVLYSVLETYSKKENQSIQVDKIELHNKMVDIFDNLYFDFIKKLEVDDADFHKNLWKKAKETFLIKENHSIVELFKRYKIDCDKINNEIKKAKIKNGKHKIKNISDLRNQLVHNRNVDNLCKLPMDLINSKLSFAVCIILLYNLGFSNITFYKDWSLLSILKVNSND